MNRRIGIFAGIILSLTILPAVGVLLNSNLKAAAVTSVESKTKTIEDYQQDVEKSPHEGLACNDCHIKSTSGVVGTASSFVESVTTTVRGGPDIKNVKEPEAAACLKCHETPKMSVDKVARVPHKVHSSQEVFSGNCVRCHTWLVHERSRIKGHQTLEISASCFELACHIAKDSEKTCYECHHSYKVTSAQWNEEHRLVVMKEGSGYCRDRCHDATQCSDCHTTGKQLETSKGEMLLLSRPLGHSGKDWKSKHGPEAFDKSAKCLDCHETSSCHSCHIKKPPSHKKKDWYIVHRKLAEENKDRCLICHTEKLCARDCHILFKQKN